MQSNLSPDLLTSLSLSSVVAGTPPSSIGSVIVAFVQNIAPVKIRLQQLPSLSFIRRCRTTLKIVCQMMAAYRLSKAKRWGTLHTDGTSRRQIAILNLIITALEDGNEDTTPKYEPILFSASILPEDETAEAQHNAITDFVEEMGQWLSKWKEAFERDNPGVPHDIDPGGLSMAKLEDGNVMTDGCNTARSVNRKLVMTITQLVKEKKDRTLGEAVDEAISQAAGAQGAECNDTGTDDGEQNDASANDGEQNDVSADNEEGDDTDTRNDAEAEEDEGAKDNTEEGDDAVNEEIAYESFCHHHIRNVWWNAINKYLTKHLKATMADSFDDIDPRL